MTTPNFDQMSKSELKAYLITHANDTQAFYAFRTYATVTSDGAATPRLAPNN